MGSGVHHRMIARLPSGGEAALVHWEVRMPTNHYPGRRHTPALTEREPAFEVNHPLESQRRFEIREPPRSSGLAFK
jgi:hypothetical protein